MFVGTWWSLMPPIVAIALALLTKEVYLSLFAGCALGALLAAEFHPWIAFDTLFNTMIDSADFSILMFMILLGMIVMLMQESGGTRAYGEWASSHLKSKRSALVTTSLLGALIFVDDYFNCLTVGSVMRPVTDKFAQHFEDWKSNKQKTRPYEITVIDDGTSTNETRLGAVKDIQMAVEKLNLADDLLVMAGDNVLNFSLSKFVEFAKEKNTSCVMCHEENELKKQQKTAIITLDGNDLITSYEEKPKEPKGNLAVPPFYCYRACDVKRIQEALDNGCGYDAPGSFAAWLSKQTPMHAYVMPGKRYDIGDINSYEYVKSVFSR